MFESLVRQLGEALQADETLSAYLLVDPMLREPFAVDWLQEESRDVWPVPVRHLQIKDRQRPRLIHLHSHDTHLLEASVALAITEQSDPDAESQQGFAFGGWLLTNASGDELARHLARCMQPTLMPKARNTLLRWADRRVLEWMWPVLTARQKAGLLRSIPRWYVLDRCGELVCYEAQANVPPQALSFSADQWAHAQQNEAVQDLLRGWLRFAGALPADYLRRAAQAAGAVIATGLTNRQDRVLLGAYILQVHPQLTSHPALHSAVDRALGGGVTLAQALEGIPDPEGWDTIRAELERDAGFASTRQIEQREQLG
jgi:hypothetical protein